MNAATPFRWRDLETILIGGQRFTSEEGLQRYFDRQSEEEDARRHGGAMSPPAAGRTARQRERAAETAAAKLAELGA